MLFTGLEGNVPRNLKKTLMQSKLDMAGKSNLAPTSDFILDEVPLSGGSSHVDGNYYKRMIHSNLKVLRVEVVRETGLINHHVFRPSLRRYCGCSKFLHPNFNLCCI
jgi:hypothetical protein